LSFSKASRFICNFIWEYFLKTCASPWRSICVTHSSATPPALSRVAWVTVWSGNRVFQHQRDITTANPRGKLKTVVLENERICPYMSEIKTELRFRRMLDPWITFRHTLPACARK
jgi:hypothetical protein